jgi:hypothetical protein
MTLPHAVVWLDHRRASIIHFNGSIDRRIALAASLSPQQHQDAIAPGHAAIDRTFFDSIADALGDALEILLVGPASKKDELAEYLLRHRPQLRRRIVAIGTVDQPTDNQLLACARDWFARHGPARDMAAAGCSSARAST